MYRYQSIDLLQPFDDGARLLRGIFFGMLFVSPFWMAVIAAVNAG